MNWARVKTTIDCVVALAIAGKLARPPPPEPPEAPPLPLPPAAGIFAALHTSRSSVLGSPSAWFAAVCGGVRTGSSFSRGPTLPPAAAAAATIPFFQVMATSGSLDEVQEENVHLETVENALVQTVFNEDDFVDEESGSYRSIFDSLFALTCWFLWKERNARVFEQKFRSTEQLVCDIKEEILVWKAAGVITTSNGDNE
uniref:Uncharacterized protein n=1 Tax=Oryza punctata TaxID=4537 RepID=A0A0E0LH15_ORYPU